MRVSFCREKNIPLLEARIVWHAAEGSAVVGDYVWGKFTRRWGDDYSEARWLRFLPVFGQKVGGFQSTAPNFLSLLRKGAWTAVKRGQHLGKVRA